MLYSKFCFLLLFSINIYASSISVIVSNDSSLDNISKKELSKIFLGKTKSLPSGERALVVESIDESNRIEFYKTVVNKNERQLKKYWAKMIFTGRAQPPRKIKDVKELIEFVKNHNNSISYISSEFLDDEVKEIMRIDK